jgi:hypothetical protein
MEDRSGLLEGRSHCRLKETKWWIEVETKTLLQLEPWTSSRALHKLTSLQALTFIGKAPTSQDLFAISSLVVRAHAVSLSASSGPQ